MTYELRVAGDVEQTFANKDEAKDAAKHRAYMLTAHSGKSEEVQVFCDNKYVGTASGHISASWRGE